MRNELIGGPTILNAVGRSPQLSKLFGVSNEKNPLIHNAAETEKSDMLGY